VGPLLANFFSVSTFALGRLGAGSNELKPANAPAPAPPILGFLRAGPSSSPPSLSGLISGRATRILRGFDLSTMDVTFGAEAEGAFENGVGLVADVRAAGVVFSCSESEASESEYATRTIVAVFVECDVDVGLWTEDGTCKVGWRLEITVKSQTYFILILSDHQ
jgi:hypothetical protein